MQSRSGNEPAQDGLTLRTQSVQHLNVNAQLQIRANAAATPSTLVASHPHLCGDSQPTRRCGGTQIPFLDRRHRAEESVWPPGEREEDPMPCVPRMMECCVGKIEGPTRELRICNC